MGEQAKCCGNCRYWEQTQYSGGMGWCGCPAPYALIDTDIDPTSPDEGANCPAFQPKPDEAD
jgi:hypothetical protein